MSTDSPSLSDSGATSPTREALFDALRAVHDPEIGLDIVSLGLVYDAHVEDGRALVTMTLTSAACPLGDFIRRDAEWRLRAVPGVRAATVTIVFDPPWSAERMSEEARVALGYSPDVGEE